MHFPSIFLKWDNASIVHRINRCDPMAGIYRCDYFTELAACSATPVKLCSVLVSSSSREKLKNWRGLSGGTARMITVLEKLVYKKRLKYLGFFSLQKRRLDAA